MFFKTSNQRIAFPTELLQSEEEASIYENLGYISGTRLSSENKLHRKSNF